MWKIKFFGLKSGQDLENRAAHSHQEFPGVPPPPRDLVLFSTGMLEGIYINQICKRNIELNNVSAVSLLGNINYRF